MTVREAEQRGRFAAERRTKKARLAPVPRVVKAWIAAGPTLRQINEHLFR